MTTPRLLDECLDTLFQHGNRSAENLQKVQQLRADDEMSRRMDAYLIERLARQQLALGQAEVHIRETQLILDKLTAPPWYPAAFIGLVETGQGMRAMVSDGRVRRLVPLAQGLDPALFCRCDEVYLGQNQNVVLGRLPAPKGRAGDLGEVKHKTSDGRLVIQCEGKTSVYYAPPALFNTVREGEQVLCDVTLGIADERVENRAANHFFLQSTPLETFENVGGVDSQIRQIREALLMHWKNPQTARKYLLPRTGSILLWGSPGTGKTLLARALANFVGTLSSSGESLFMSVKPGELHTAWYSESERNYRELFRVAREKSTPEKPVIIFLDEVDSIGASRGQSHMRVHDNVLTALIAELDGLAERGNILVVAATNRRDSLDPALIRPGRLGDLILEVPRPNRPAARDIFSKHLQPGVPFARNGHGDDQEATRQELIEAALARIYSPNGEGELATITFRDNSQRAVRPADLASGAVVAGICRNAKAKACRREIETGAEGVTAEDLLLAVSEEFRAAAGSLAIGNCRQHLADLPQDIDIVKVQSRAGKGHNPLRYLQAA